MDNLDLFFYFPGASSAILLCMVTEPKYLKSAIWKINVWGQNFDVSINILALFSLWRVVWISCGGTRTEGRSTEACVRAGTLYRSMKNGLDGYTIFLHRLPNYCLREGKEGMRTLLLALLSARALSKMRVTCGITSVIPCLAGSKPSLWQGMKHRSRDGSMCAPGSWAHFGNRAGDK